MLATAAGIALACGCGGAEGDTKTAGADRWEQRCSKIEEPKADGPGWERIVLTDGTVCLVRTE